MTELQYKTFVWPQNPAEFQILSQRDAVLDPDKNFTGPGTLHQVIQGEGTFVGPSAYADFKQLAALIHDSTPGALVHPVWGTFQAYLMDLSCIQEPEENCVKYRFTFRTAE